MTWTHHHDPAGVPDFPDECSFNTRILDYWTNDSIRIGFVGHAKGIAIFTFRNADLNFKFEVIKAADGSTYIPEKADRTLGPKCEVYLNPSRTLLIGGKSVMDERESLFANQPVGEIKSAITDFLLIYRDPRFPSPVRIEEILFPQTRYLPKVASAANTRQK